MIVFLPHRPIVCKVDFVAMNNLKTRMLLSNFFLKDFYINRVTKAFVFSNRNARET
nr:MAG TPA_asm: hypothetical protein [Caudoviricetes sp.]